MNSFKNLPVGLKAVIVATALIVPLALWLAYKALTLPELPTETAPKP